MNNLLLFICFILINLSCAETIIYISPKENVLQGERVNISCTFAVEPSIIKWMLNKKDVGEDKSSYVPGFFEIQNTGLRYDLIIKHASLIHRGIWSCAMANAKSQEVTLNISVAWTLKAISAKKIYDRSRKITNHNAVTETGQKRFPYDITMNQTLQISCASECGLPAPKSISIRYTNFTNTGELTDGKQTSESCKDNAELSLLNHTISINCLTSRLVGRNEIWCQSQGLGGNTLSNKPIFILCPTYKNTSDLTKGEMIAIAVAMFLAIFDVVIIVMLLRQNCRQVSNLSQSKSEIIRCPEVML